MVYRPDIAVVGRCNSGKSTIVNALLGEAVSIVSPEAGTTTDPVRRAVELRGYGAVTVTDTAGLDDYSTIGESRRKATIEALERCDMALLVIGRDGKGSCEEEIETLAHDLKLPLVEIYNSFDGDTQPAERINNTTENESHFIFDPLNDPKERLHDFLATRLKPAERLSLFGDKISRGDDVVLVCPIDSEAPAGRLILPQVQALRELLDKRAIAHVVQPDELSAMLDKLTPRMVVTDSQAISQVSAVVNNRCEVTTFSILLAAAKGDMEQYENGLKALDTLKAGDKILVMESCLHHVGCEDIGRVKIPRWLEAYVGVSLSFDFISGTQPLPDHPEQYALALQCGGCMVTPAQIRSRLRRLKRLGVPTTNYGMAIRKIKNGQKNNL